MNLSAVERAVELARRCRLRKLLAIAERESIRPKQLAAGIRKAAKSFRKENNNAR